MKLPLLIAALFASTLAFSQAQPDKEARAAAEQTVHRFVDSWNREDGKAYGENYWPDAELVNPSGGIVKGRAAIAKEHVDLWAGIFKGSHMAATLRKVRRLDPNHIIVDFDTELSHVQKPPPGAPPNGVIKTHLKHILEKRHGEWKVVAAQNTFIAPPR
jgi:uncharacterized protein (TIGR02246 family)